MGKPLLNTSEDANVQWERTLTMSEPEESVLVTMARFFIDNGWIDEVRSLVALKEEMEIDFPALDSIGYKQIIDYLNGLINKDSLIETIVSKTWQYAKKQHKWFKKENVDLIIDTTDLDPIRVSDCIYDIYESIN